MGAYLIVMLSPAGQPATKQVVSRIEKLYPGSYPLPNGQGFLVRSPDVAELIAHKVGLAGEERSAPDEQAAGLVVRIGSYFGFASSGLWEWLGEDV